MLVPELGTTCTDKVAVGSAAAVSAAIEDDASSKSAKTHPLILRIVLFGLDLDVERTSGWQGSGGKIDAHEIARSFHNDRLVLLGREFPLNHHFAPIIFVII